jgi:photosystem II stability/assembly factor-like uncharacterized protein
VVAVSADPVRPNVFYFGAVAGGIWRSDDAGQYWENISDGQLDTASVGALAVAPSDGNVIYAGMGEATIRIDVTHGDGVYRSTDGGTNWHHCGLAESRHIGAIAVDPTDADTVFVAALGHASKDNPERGLYRSRDGGDTWDLVLHVSDRAGAVDVSVDPNNPRIVFATIWQARRTFWSIDSGGPDCGLWRSLDGGDTWTDLSRNEGMPTGTLGKIGVAVSPARPGTVYTVVEAEGRKRGMYRSDDNGETWTKTSSNPELCWRPWYYQHVVAHPTDPETVYVLNRGAWVSIDGGKNFEEFPTPHGDNHGLWIDPTNPERMIGCDDGGAWVSLNAGRSWSTIYNQLTAQLYHVAVDDQYPYLVYGTQQDNSSIAVPSRTGKGAINWGDCYPPGTAESGYVAVKPGDPNVVYVGAIGSSPGGGDALQRYDHRTGQVQLVSVWPEAYHDGNTAEVRFQWTYPIVFSPQDPNTLYACGNKVFRSRDEGMSWEAISEDLTHADPATMGVSGPLTMDTAGAEMYATIFSFLASAHRPGTLMTGSDDGLVHRSTDDGGSWTDVTPPEVEKFSQVTMLAESPHTEGRVYMTVARHKMGDYTPYVYVTDDWGDSWRLITDGIPDGEFCRVVREDPNRAGLLYLGTELGLHASFDGGAHWQPLQANLPVTPVYDLLVKDTDLVVATHGRSFWILDDVTQLHQAAEGFDTSAPALLAPRDTVRTPPDLFADFWGMPGGNKNYHVTIGQNATFYLDESKTGHKTKRVIDAGTDLEAGVRIPYWLPEGLDEGEDGATEVTLTISTAEGEEIETFSSVIPEEEADRKGRLYLTAEAGMNSFQWPMRWPAGVRMDGSDFHGPSTGPLALPGTYRATLTVGDRESTVSFDLLADPRVTASTADFEAQFELLRRIQDCQDEAVTAVNRIRALERRLGDWKSRIDEEADASSERAGELAASIDGLVERLEGIEGELVQSEFTNPGDTLNYREKLIEKLSALPPVVGSADAAPTKQSYEVFDKLAGQIDEQLGALDELIQGDLATLNDRLGVLGLGFVGA